jgi:hypothetical protein
VRRTGVLSTSVVARVTSAGRTTTTRRTVTLVRPRSVRRLRAIILGP